MYQYSYAEVLEDDQTEARRNERMALDRAISMLRIASAAPASSKQGIEALTLTRELWTIFVTQLASPENELPDALRAQLISIGFWIMRETDAIRLGASTNYAGIADICAIVREGLR